MYFRLAALLDTHIAFICKCVCVVKSVSDSFINVFKTTTFLIKPLVSIHCYLFYAHKYEFNNLISQAYHHTKARSRGTLMLHISFYNATRFSSSHYKSGGNDKLLFHFKKIFLIVHIDFKVARLIFIFLMPHMWFHCEIFNLN